MELGLNLGLLSIDPGLVVAMRLKNICFPGVIRWMK
jgi:hypothetical protein